MKRQKQDNIGTYLKSIEDFEGKYIGIEEHDSDDTDENMEMPYNISDIRVEQKMVTIYQIESWIDKGMLNLHPEYQRNLVWDIRRKTALIESLLLRIPFPAFCLDEDENGYKTVIDGMQRLNTIHEFIQGEFRLKGMQYLPECEKKFFRELPLRYQTYIMETVLVINILDARCPQVIKFDVFRRINTCGLQLNSQEIRNIMAKPQVRKILKEMSTCKEFRMATGGGVNDIRMGAQELCLRVLTIWLHYDWNGNKLFGYHGLIKTMDNTIIQLNMYLDQGLYDTILKDFKCAMRQAHMILQDDCFSKSGRGQHGRVNAALFTSWITVLVHLELSDEWIKQNSEEIYRFYRKHLEDKDVLYHAVTSSTGSRRNVLTALDMIRQILEAFL